MQARRRITGSGSSPRVDSEVRYDARTYSTTGAPYQTSGLNGNLADNVPYPSDAGQQTRPAGTSPNTFGQNYGDEMSCRERTGEFQAVCKSMQSRQSNGHAAHTQNKTLAQRSEFTQIARKIGKDLSNTFSKLEKLAILARRKSLFDDKPEEIQQLTFIIKQDIASLNKQIAQLQSLSKSQAGRQGRNRQAHTNSVVVGLQQKLASMSNDFKSVLEVRTENLKQQRNRREEFSQSVPGTSSMPPSALEGHAGSVLLHDELHRRSGHAANEFSINMDDVQRQRYQQQLQLIDEQDSYIQSRADTMQNIESTIVELGSIFTQLATMVKEQEEMVQRIDSNVEDTAMNVEAAHSEILKYFQSVTSNRWLMIKVFGVLIFFFIVFVVFMA